MFSLQLYMPRTTLSRHASPERRRFSDGVCHGMHLGNGHLHRPTNDWILRLYTRLSDPDICTAGTQRSVLVGVSIIA